MEEIPPLLQLPVHTQQLLLLDGGTATTCSSLALAALGSGRGGGCTAAVDGNVPGNAFTAAVAAGRHRVTSRDPSQLATRLLYLARLFSLATRQCWALMY
jgi:hypothetical protein